MTTDIVKAGVDAFVNSNRPNKNFRTTGWLRVQSGVKEALIRLKSPAAKKSTILDAWLVLEQEGDVAGPVTITAQRTADRPEIETVTWDTKPGSTGPTGTLTKNAPADGTVWEIPVVGILQDIADGEPAYGFRITSSSGNEIRFRSLNASKGRPYLKVRWTTRPDAPTVLKPAFGPVSTGKPVLSCDYTDHSGSTDLIAMQVQIDAVKDGVSPDWDSGEVSVTIPQLDLADTAYPGLAAGLSTYWHVRVKDGDGLWSLWSDWVPFSRVAKGVLDIVSPGIAPNDFVSEFTPPIVWSFTGTQTHYRVMIAPASNPKKILHDSEKLRGSTNSYTLPKRVLKDGKRYRVTVQVWDDVDREATSGDPVYTQNWTEFIVDYDPTINPPDYLFGNQPDTRPWETLVIGLATAPDSLTIMRDDEAIDTDVPIGDLEVGDVEGGIQSYLYRDWTARPEVEHTYKVRAEVNGKLSHASPSVTVTPAAVGIWLADPSTGQEVVLGGLDFDTAQDDLAETYAVLGSTAVVRTVMGLSGLSGTVTDAMLRSRDGFTWDALEATLNDFKSRPTDEFRLVMGDLNIPVILGDVKIAPSPLTIRGRVIKAVSFAFWQVDEFGFEVRL